MKISLFLPAWVCAFAKPTFADGRGRFLQGDTMTIYTGYIVAAEDRTEATSGDSKIYTDASMTEEAGTFGLSK